MHFIKVTFLPAMVFCNI